VVLTIETSLHLLSPSRESFVLKHYLLSQGAALELQLS